MAHLEALKVRVLHEKLPKVQHNEQFARVSNSHNLLLLLSLDADNHLDDYSGTFLGLFAKQPPTPILKLLHCLKFLRI